MHRRFYEGSVSHFSEADMADQYLQFALLQSNQAIKELLKGRGPDGRMTGSDKITLMTCCVLFSSMACLQGHQREGMQHLRSGIRLLKEIDEDQEQNLGRHPVNIESLRSMFVGLDMQARSIMSTVQQSTWEPPPQSKEPPLRLNAALDDATLIAVQLRLQSIVNDVLAFLPTSSQRPVEDWDTVSCDHQSLLKRFRHISEILDKLNLKAAHDMKGQYAQQLTAVQLLHSQLEYYLRYPRVDLADKFPFLQDYLNEPVIEPGVHMARMLELAAQLLPHNASLSPVFTTCMGPLSALWLIATRAPSECTAIRKRAVRLMLSAPRREGFWDSMVAGQIAAEVLKWEQESAQAELGLEAYPSRDLVVPDDLRMAAVMLLYDEVDERRATLEFQNARDLAMGRRGKIQVLIW